MGEENGQGETTEETQGQQSQDDAGTGINPAWNDLLDALPSQLQPIVTPHLQQWDKNYQEGVQKVHSEYEDFKPFKEQGITQEQLNYGLQLIEALENRPEEVYKSMQKWFESQNGGNQNEQQTQEQGQDPQKEQGPTSPEIDIKSLPEFQQLAEVVNALTEQTVQQERAKQDAQADAEVEAEVKAAQEKHGYFDLEWVFAKVMGSDFKISIDEAAAQYKDFEKSILEKANKPGPKVLSAGGSTPNQSVDPSTLDGKDRVAYVADMLARAKANNG